MQIIIAILVLATGYVLGSISFAVLVARSRGVNIFETGSGNPGATNVLRSLGKGPGYLVFFLDFLKGFTAAFWPIVFSGEEGIMPWLPILGLAGAIAGHSFSVFLKFRGGKGVATTVGGMLAMQPFVILIGIALWLAVFYGTRFVSLASLVLGISLPISSWFFQSFPGDFYFSLLLAVLIVVRHKKNIGRLLRGEESRFVKK